MNSVQCKWLIYWGRVMLEKVLLMTGVDIEQWCADTSLPTSLVGTCSFTFDRSMYLLYIQDTRLALRESTKIYQVLVFRPLTLFPHRTWQHLRGAGATRSRSGTSCKMKSQTAHLESKLNRKMYIYRQTLLQDLSLPRAFRSSSRRLWLDSNSKAITA